MKLRHILTLSLCLGAAAAQAEPYRVVVPLSEDENGTMARLVNYDTGAAIDSVEVSNQVATFTGDIDGSVIAAVRVDGVRLPVFILESGTISFSNADGQAFGSMLNDQQRELGNSLRAMATEYRTASPMRQQIIETQYEQLMDSTIAANSDNALGLLVFLNSDISSADAAGIREALDRYPAFASSQRVAQYLEKAQRRERTQPGNPFLDFEITNGDDTFRLSDHVGKGHYVLVDFWASWCGPCMRQLPVLKEIYNEHKDQGLEVIGVAVWDEPDDTRRAIQQHELPWECVIGAGTIPTDLYGISGIPCIILFGPDGTIISRDLQGDELKAAVNAVF